MEFYCLEQPKIGSPEDRECGLRALKTEDAKFGDPVFCPKCRSPLSMMEWLPPFEIELETFGKRYGDVASIGRDLIISERFAQAYASSGLTGLTSVAPVEIVKLIHRRGKPKTPPPRYFKAAVAQSRTTIDQQASGFVWEEPTKVCPECLFDSIKRYQKQIVLADTWTGEDVFVPRGGFGVLVNERFKAFVAENQLIGIRLIPTDSCEAGYDSDPWETEAAAKEQAKSAPPGGNGQQA